MEENVNTCLSGFQDFRFDVDVLAIIFLKVEKTKIERDWNVIIFHFHRRELENRNR